MQKLYIKVTRDEYELPLIVAASPGELARKCGVTKNSVLKSIALGKDPKRWSSYRRVIIDDD